MTRCFNFDTALGELPGPAKRPAWREEARHGVPILTIISQAEPSQSIRVLREDAASCELDPAVVTWNKANMCCGHLVTTIDTDCVILPLMINRRAVVQ